MRKIDSKYIVHVTYTIAYRVKVPFFLRKEVLERSLEKKRIRKTRKIVEKPLGIDSVS